MKTKIRSVFAIAAALAALPVAGCGNNETACAAIAIAALNIQVKDPAGAPVCDAKVEATQAGWSETLKVPGSMTGDCTYAGAYERSGDFTVTVSKTGFNTETLMITVGRNVCHPNPERRTVTLTAM